MKLEHFITAEGKRLRCGYTTGTCAAGAARCGAEALLSGRFPPAIQLEIPAELTITLEPEACTLGADYAACGIRKDGGDDVDLTHGALIMATVRKIPCGIEILGGEGIGRVTLPGLDQPVGEAAINSVPRQMITQQLQLAMEQNGYNGGLQVVISSPQGAELAKRTFNPRLGIQGGFSILGTTGLVRPMSRQAIVDTTRLELEMKLALGHDAVLISPGNFGAEFSEKVLRLGKNSGVECSNYIGEALDTARLLGFRSVLLVGHIGKLCKLAAGIFDTHSRTADGRREIFVTSAALCGGDLSLLQRLYACPTTDACLDCLRDCGLLAPVMEQMRGAIGENLRRRGAGLQVECIVFSRVHGLLTRTEGAEALLQRLRQQEE